MPARPWKPFGGHLRSLPSTASPWLSFHGFVAPLIAVSLFKDFMLSRSRVGFDSGRRWSPDLRSGQRRRADQLVRLPRRRTGQDRAPGGKPFLTSVAAVSLLQEHHGTVRGGNGVGIISHVLYSTHKYMATCQSPQSAMSLSLIKGVAALLHSVVLVVTLGNARLLPLLRSPPGLPLPASKHKILVRLSPYMLVPCWRITLVISPFLQHCVHCSSTTPLSSPE